MPRKGNAFHRHILARTSTHISLTESNGPLERVLLPPLIVWYIIPTNHQADLPEERKPVLGQAWDPQRARSESQHSLNKHLLTVRLT